jgi:hypothetical protein
MRYTAEQFEALIYELTEEVNLYENLVLLDKESNWNRLIVAAALLLLIATISSGGFCHDELSRTFGIGFIAVCFYYYKLSLDKQNLMDKLTSVKSKLKWYKEELASTIHDS